VHRLGITAAALGNYFPLRVVLLNMETENGVNMPPGRECPSRRDIT